MKTNYEKYQTLLSNYVNITCKGLIVPLSHFLVFFYFGFVAQNITSAQSYYNWTGPSGGISVSSDNQKIRIQADPQISKMQFKNLIDTLGLPVSPLDTSEMTYVSALETDLHIINTQNTDSLVNVIVSTLVNLGNPNILGCKKYYWHNGFLLQSTQSIVIKVNSSTNISDLITYCNGYSGFVLDTLFLNDNQFLLRIPENENMFNVMQSLQALNYVSFVEPNFLAYSIQTINDPLFPNQWYLKNTGSNCGNLNTCTAGQDINMETGWLTLNGCGYTKISVLDDGVQANHEDFTYYLKRGYNAFYFQNNFDKSWNSNSGFTSRAFYLNGGRIHNYNGRNDANHGTACTGIILAESNNNIGIAGMAHQLDYEPIKCISSFGTSETAVISAAYRISYDSAQSHVLSCSFIWPYPSGTMSSSIDYFVNQTRNGLGGVICHSSGNRGDPIICQSDFVYYPSKLDNVIAVGASNTCDTRVGCNDCSGTTNWSSNFGDELDIVAPGLNIETTDVHGPFGYSSTRYSSFSGTSSATPQVAATFGLVLSVNPFLYLAQARQIVESTADRVGGYSYSNNSSHPNGTWNNEMGYGRLNTGNAVELSKTTEIKLHLFYNGIDNILSNTSPNYYAAHLPHNMLRIKSPGSEVDAAFQIKWYRDGVLINDNDVFDLPFNAPGKYFATLRNNCTNTLLKTETVELILNCNDQDYDFTLQNGYINNGMFSVSNTVYYIEEDFVNNNLVTANNCVFIFDNCASFINNGTMNVTNCEFVSCTEWQGIVANGVNSITNLDNCTIQNATAGIYATNDAYINIENSKFSNNHIHVLMENCNSSSNGLKALFKCKFGELKDNGLLTLSCDPLT
jgi:subtilisin family serine protease